MNRLPHQVQEGRPKATATIEPTKDNFGETVAGSEIVLIDVRAAWWGPCRMFGPVHERAAAQRPDTVFGKVDTDTDTQPEPAAAFRISSVPTLTAVRDRTVLYARPAALVPQTLTELIGRIRAVGMDDVRRHAARSAAAH